MLMGIGIDQIVNSQEAKEQAKSSWKYRMQFLRFEKECNERDYKKYESWLEKHLGESLRNFLKYGDQFNIMKYMRPFAKFCAKSWPIWFLIGMILGVYHA